MYVAGGEWINHSSYMYALYFHLLVELGVRAFEQPVCWSMLQLTAWQVEQAPSAFQGADGENVGNRLGKDRDAVMGLCGEARLAAMSAPQALNLTLSSCLFKLEASMAFLKVL